MPATIEEQRLGVVEVLAKDAPDVFGSKRHGTWPKRTPNVRIKKQESSSTS